MNNLSWFVNNLNKNSAWKIYNAEVKNGFGYQLIIWEDGNKIGRAHV